MESLLMDEQAWQSHQALAHEDKLDAPPPSNLYLIETEAVAWRQVPLLRQMVEQEKILVNDVATALDLISIKPYLSSKSRTSNLMLKQGLRGAEQRVEE